MHLFLNSFNGIVQYLLVYIDEGDFISCECEEAGPALADEPATNTNDALDSIYQPNEHPREYLVLIEAEDLPRFARVGDGSVELL